MKVVDITVYRRKKAVIEMEKRISNLYTQARPGIVKEIKLCFKEWVKMTS